LYALRILEARERALRKLPRNLRQNRPLEFQII
jgi:hypothetical protein